MKNTNDSKIVKLQMAKRPDMIEGIVAMMCGEELTEEQKNGVVAYKNIKSVMIGRGEA